MKHFFGLILVFVFLWSGVFFTNHVSPAAAYDLLMVEPQNMTPCDGQDNDNDGTRDYKVEWIWGSDEYSAKVRVFDVYTSDEICNSVNFILSTNPSEFVCEPWPGYETILSIKLENKKSSNGGVYEGPQHFCWVTK